MARIDKNKLGKNQPQDKMKPYYCTEQTTPVKINKKTNKKEERTCEIFSCSLNNTVMSSHEVLKLESVEHMANTFVNDCFDNTWKQLCVLKIKNKNEGVGKQ